MRPIVLLDGEAEVNEVFFDNVKVPAENLVGEENKGWTYAKYLLTHERTNIAGVGYSTAALANLKRIAGLEMQDGKPLIENPLFAAKVAQVEIDLMAMATTNLRVVAQAAAGQAPGPESSMLKIKGTVIRQEINASDAPRGRALRPALRLRGAGGRIECRARRPRLRAARDADYFNNRKLSIYGGSNEMQRAIITKAILEL